MNVFSMILVSVGCHSFFLAEAHAEVRNWTRASDGKQISARFVGMRGDDIVKIEVKDGHVFEVPLERLSPEDGEFVKSQISGMQEEALALPQMTSTGSDGGIRVTLSGVHLCCGSCVNDVAEIESNVGSPLPAGVSISADRKAKSIIVTAAGESDAQQALEAILKAGFYGVSDHPNVAIPELKADESVTSVMELHGTHLCCGACVKAFSKAACSVEGVKTCHASSGVDLVKLKGENFKPYEVLAVLRDAGFGASYQ